MLAGFIERSTITRVRFCVGWLRSKHKVRLNDAGRELSPLATPVGHLRKKGLRTLGTGLARTVSVDEGAKVLSESDSGDLQGPGIGGQVNAALFQETTGPGGKRQAPFSFG